MLNSPSRYEFDPSPPSLKHAGIDSWAKERPDPWVFVSWIKRNSGIGDFDEILGKATKSDHGEKREADLYNEGAVIWIQEKPKR